MNNSIICSTQNTLKSNGLCGKGINRFQNLKTAIPASHAVAGEGRKG